MTLVFANQSEEDAIYPLTTREIALVQQQDSDLNTQAKKEGYSMKLVKNIKVLCKQGKMVIPKSLQRCTVFGFTTTCNTHGPNILKKPFVFQCLGKVYE